MTHERVEGPTAQLREALVERAGDAPDALAVALVELAGLVVDEEPLGEVLRRVVDLAVAVVPGCTGAGVTLMDGDRPETAAHTDDRVLAVDRQQYEAGDGPCLDAIRNRVLHRVDLDAAEQRWPDFAERARALGVRSFLAAPLVAGDRAVGALNLYGDGPRAFDPLDDALVTLFAGQASVALANARLYARAVALGEQLSAALETRAVIEQAKGVLACTLGLEPEQAFAELRRRSQTGNRKLRDIAAEVVALASACGGHERSGSMSLG